MNLVFICIMALPSASCIGGPCEEIGDVENWYFNRSLKTCYMQSTVIKSTEYIITTVRDLSMEGFDSWRNKRFEHLPINLGERFPNLINLDVQNCSIKVISKRSFKGVSKLRALGLYQNLIEKIDGDTFDYVPALEAIDLRE